MTKCTNVVLLEHLNEDDDMLEVTIDDTVTAYMVAKYGDILKYVGQDVIVSYRNDIYKGVLRQFIDTVTIPTIVNTLDREENVKLYVEQEDNFSNVCFADIAEGETKLNAKMYCISHEYNSSANAVWAELKVRDKSMRVATLRLFDYDYNKYDYSGRYILADIRRSKYGLQTQLVTPTEDNCAVNPEITIARQYILNTFKDDKEILDIISGNNLLECMEQIIDIEKGYLLVRTAMELDIASGLVNVTNTVDVSLIKRVLLLSSLYTITPNTEYSKRFTNMVNVSKVALSDKKEVMLLLDDEECSKPESIILKNIKETVNNLIFMKKGLL